MPKLNRTIIRYDIGDCVEELQKILEKIAARRPLDEIEYRVAMQHAFHHLNFAWNARRWPMKRYERCAERDFKKAGDFPKDLLNIDD
jgi:hypothetical protein